MKSKSVERDLSPEKTKAILDGAMQEFLENGYAAARIDKIAVAAGVSKATIYRRFPDKESLFIELVQQLACEKELFNPNHLLSAQGDVASFLKSFANMMLTHVADDPQSLTFLRIIIGESGRFPELAQAFVRNIEKPMLQAMTHYLGSHPELELPDPEVAARAFMGTLIHFVLLRDVLHGGDIVPIDRDRLVDQLVKLIIK
ncbi:TetR/AcrR family transcriptional regulator [Nostoc sp. LEGE 06077]|uniref:TetR/AcrR family transcriptional regulator n=1 Tax=Nostoc sp. LEGE 06077 TaxID=915325 RepID=UPI00188057DF|nr:TetR/AcrR family transcriptional regulator [Nostoc sp. LEGE 06077]MBE9208380.1 TetR/AcrR family transcriptional regulator [Nostoc sp. LEGE 06077]